MDRAYSLLEIKAVDEDARVITGIASTPSPDRMGDVVEPKGAQFALPIPLLWQHDSHSPIGQVTQAKVTKNGIEIVATIAKGVSEEIDRAWNLIKSGLVRGLSIGFRGIDVEQIPNSWGVTFKIWEWLELSAVTIPANAEATITSIKSIDRKQMAASGRKSARTVRLLPAGASAPTKPKAPQEGMEMKKTIAEQISGFEAMRQAKSAEMGSIMETAGDRGETLDAENKEKYDTLRDEVKEIDEHLVRLRDHQKTIEASAKTISGDDPASGSRSRQPGQTIQVKGSPAQKGSGLVRMLGARFMAREFHIPAAEVAKSKGWTDIEDVLRIPPDILAKAAVTAGSTTDSAWAGALVTYNNLQNEFIELLRPKTIIGRIPGIRMVPFNVKVPRETGETTAYWVNQGSPKPVSKGALDTVTLDFNKVAGLTFMTKELMRFSQPAAEGVMINSLTKAIIKLTDNDFLDPSKSAVTGVSPASITNGATSITASGTTADAFRADFADLLANYTASNYSLDDLVVVMGQSQALRLGLMRNDFGGKEFPDINKDGGFIEGVPVVTSENVAANGGSPADGRIIVALAANSILMADDGGVEVNISTEASIQTDDSPDSPQTASTVLVSMFQTNQVAILCERFITWTKARSGAAVYITGGNYG